MALSKRRQQMIRSIERAGEVSARDIAPRAKKEAAFAQLTALWKEWLDAETPEEPRLKRLVDQMEREVKRLSDEISDGKTEQIADRFQHTVERVTAATLPKRKVTYLQTLDALQALLKMNRQWHKAAPRSKADQDRALHTLHVLLREIEAGHIEHLADRFQEAEFTSSNERGKRHDKSVLGKQT